MGLNAALAMAGRSLEVFSTGMQVAGQNISNAATPGYIREELQLKPANPYRSGSQVFGTGVLVGGIRQKIDRFLEVRLHAASSDASAAEARNTIFKQLEGQVNELGSADLSTSLSRFMGALQEVATSPDSASARELLIDQGQQLATDIGDLRARVDQLRRDQTVKINSLVEEANDLIRQIAQLNPEITKLESAGLLQSDAGALRTQRYNALNRLAEIIPVKFAERENGTVDVFTGSEYLILQGHTQQLQMTAGMDRGVDVQYLTLSETRAPLPMIGGALTGVIQGRDDILGGFVDDLDLLARNLIQSFNEVHASGEGLRGFTAVTGTTQVLETASPLNAAGLAFPPHHGSFQIRVANLSTGIAETFTVPIDLDGIDPANDTSLVDLRDYINANVTNVTAAITNDGLFRMTTADGYEIRFSNDTSGTLAALGINTFFTGSDSNSIGMNSLLVSDQRYLAAGQGGGSADGRNALTLVNFLRTPREELLGQSVDGFYDLMQTAVAQGSAAEGDAAAAFQDLHDSLSNQRTQMSGVSLDEETILLLQFQRAYQSAARLISTIDELYQALLNM